MSETKPEVAVAKRQTSTVEHFNPDDSASLFMQTSLFEQVQRAAMMLSKSNLVPAHLRGEDKVADCFLVIEQAMRWRMSPFAVAQSTYVLSGKLGYEGKLIAAVVNASPRLSKALSYEYSGSGNDRKVIVRGTLKGETEPRVIDGSVVQWATDRNPKWRDLTDQMLAYRGAREWARRHMPEVILGVYADEELEQIATRPSVTTVSTQSLDDFLAPESVTAKDDPKHEARPEPVEAEVIKPSPKEDRGPTPPIDNPTGGSVPKAVAKKAATKRDQEVDELFG